MVSENRSQVVTVRVAPTEYDMLQELAAADGVYQSDVIRVLIRRAHAERFGPPSKKASKKTQR